MNRLLKSKLINHLIFLVRLHGRKSKIFIQSLQGLVLERALSKHLAIIESNREKPFFVKVGANDGITGDPCGNRLLRMENWQGHLIEPIPYVYANLLKVYGDQRRFKCHQVAISASNGTAPIYFLSPKAKENIPTLPHYWDQLASFNAGHIEKHFGTITSPYVTTLKVPTLRLGDFIVKNRIVRLDFLHIDTEGHDLVVLESMDFSICKPSVLLIEVKHLTRKGYSRVRNILSDAGYKCLFTSGSDLLASKERVGGITILWYAWFLILGIKIYEKLLRKSLAKRK
ncbi:FkbM family methyltransferase [Synechococcus sp. AH-736-G20]|nr:FkbM family methyltransferase [Synechococcus sp. AH-736-G20]